MLSNFNNLSIIPWADALFRNAYDLLEIVKPGSISVLFFNFQLYISWIICLLRFKVIIRAIE